MLQCPSFDGPYNVDHPTPVKQEDLSQYVDRQSVEVMQGQTVVPAMEPNAMVMPHPAMLGLPIAQATMVLAGYRDCAAEAVRYLIEDEHMSPDDPFVMGLRNHLYECQKRLDLHNILRHYDIVTTQSEQSMSLDDSGISDHVTDNINTSTPDESNCVVNQSNGSDVISHSVNIESLQNNNPAISALAEELFFLLEEEDQGLSDVDSDEDIVEQ